MAKQQAHRRRPAKVRQNIPLYRNGDRHDLSETHAINCSHDNLDTDMSTRALFARIALVIVLAAAVATLGTAAVMFTRRGSEPILADVEPRKSDTAATATTDDYLKLQSQKEPSVKPKPHKFNMKSGAATTEDSTNKEYENKVTVTQVPAQNQPNNFQSTLLKELIIRDIVVDGRPVSGQELVGSKKRPELASTRVYLFEDFLSDHECNGLINAHRNHVSQYSEDPIMCFDSVNTLQKHLRNTRLRNIKVSRSDFTEGTTCVNSSFSRELKSILGWSYSTAFYPGETKFTSVFDNRVYQATGLKPSNGGKYQITSYNEGIGYKSHTDCTIGNQDPRDRMGTILVYLQDVEAGGQTEFPELGISVTPRKGRAIVWNNQNAAGQCDPYSLHVAQQVIKGQKIILQRWYYHMNFYMLGKRPIEPDLPLRSTRQPLVSCDEYDHGSCRWYDEWNYDHLTQYRQVKNQLQ